MPIEVEGPKGIETFPDGTSHEEINTRMQSIYGGAGSLKPGSVSKPGSATPASGAIMPDLQSTPPYRSDEDWDNLMLTKMFPHAAQVIQNTPGHKRAVAQEEIIGKNLGNLQERQRGGVQVLDMLHQLGTTADEGHASGALDQAIGPVNESDTFQRVRGAIPGVSRYYEKGYNLHNQLMHDIDGLTTAFIASAGKGGITMSDARQKAFNDTMGRMMRSTNKEEFDKIKQDAERIIRGTFGLAPGATVQPTRSARTAPPPASTASGQVYHNPATGEKIQWDGKQWQKVN